MKKRRLDYLKGYQEGQLDALRYVRELLEKKYPAPADGSTPQCGAKEIIERSLEGLFILKEEKGK